MTATQERPPEAVSGALARALPSADVERATLLGEGWVVVAWRVPAEDGDWVLRVPKAEWGRGETERQTCLMPRLRALGFPVVDGARLLCDERGRTLAGLHRYAEGEPARPKGRRERLDLARQLGAFLTRLHVLDPAVYAECGCEPRKLWPDLYAPLIERSGERLGPRSRVWVEAAGQRLEAAWRSAPRPVPLHADLRAEHVLLDGDGHIARVIDWSGPQVADPAFEFARLEQFFGRTFAELTLDHYGGEIDANFRERMHLYAALQPLWTIDWIAVGAARVDPTWATIARRRIAAYAGAASTRR